MRDFFPSLPYAERLHSWCLHPDGVRSNKSLPAKSRLCLLLRTECSGTYYRTRAMLEGHCSALAYTELEAVILGGYFSSGCMDSPFKAFV